MKTKKILISLLLIMICFINQAYAAMSNGNCGDNATFFLVDNVLTISGTGAVDDDEGWLDYCDIIDTLIINEGIEELGARMFDGFEILSEVSLPNTLTTIAARTFRNCTAIESIIIPDSVTSINANSFQGCDNLVIYCSANSYAEQYAVDNSIEYKIISDITISFDANGGDGAPTPLTGSIIDSFTIPNQKPTKKGSIFVGWADNSIDTEAKYQIGDEVDFTDDTTLYAVWLHCYFTDLSTENAVVINSNVAIQNLDLYVAAYCEDNSLLGVISKPVNLKYGVNRIETGADWSNLDRKFVKAVLWDKDLVPYTPCKNLLLTKNYEVVFEDWDGTVLGTQSVLTGTDATLPVTPSRAGYEFCGWSGNYTNVTNNATIVAQYIDSSKNNVFKVYSAKGAKEDTIKLTVCLGGIVETCGFDMRLRYDKNALEFIDANGELDLDAVVKHDDASNTISFNYSSASNRIKSARILEVEFKIKETAEGSTTLKLSPIEIVRVESSQDNIPVDADYTIEDGVITIN